MITKKSEPVIKINKISKYFKDSQVLNDINLEVYAGEVLVIMGPSGSGKSTLLRTITGLESVQFGEILISNKIYNCKNLKKLKCEKRAEVGMVFQQFNLYPHMTALENVMLALRQVKKKTKNEAIRIAVQFLKKVGLWDKCRFYPVQLSGGEQQRVAIARSLATQPKVILFDEPTSALDPELVHEVLETIAKLSVSGVTMVIATHELGFARRVASRIAFIDKGEIIEIGKPDDIIINPQNEHTKAFMDKFLHFTIKND